MHSSSEGSISPESRLSRERRIRVNEVWSGSDPQMIPESSDPRLVKSSLFLLSFSFPPWTSPSVVTFPDRVDPDDTSAEPAPPTSIIPAPPPPQPPLLLLLVLLLRLLLLQPVLPSSAQPLLLTTPPPPPSLMLIPRVLAGVLGGFVEEDCMILVHIVVPRIEFVHRVFSDSALGDETSTSGILWRALSKLRFRWCWVMFIRVLVTCDTGGNRIPIDLKSKLRFLWCVDSLVFWGAPAGPFPPPPPHPPPVRPCTEGIALLLLVMLLLLLPLLPPFINPRLLLRLSLGLWKRLLLALLLLPLLLHC